MPRPRKTPTFASTLRKSGFVDGDMDILGPVETLSGGKKPKFGMNWVLKSDWIVNLGPVPIVDQVTTMLLAEHRRAIRAGMKADGSGKQKALLRRGRLADPERKSQHRGFREGQFSDTIARSKITTVGGKFRQSSPGKGKSGPRQQVFSAPRLSAKRGKTRPFATKARSSIGATQRERRQDDQGNAGRYVYMLGEEAGRGVEYFYVEGAMSSAIDAVVRGWLDGAAVGGVEKPNGSSLLAKQASRSKR